MRFFTLLAFFFKEALKNFLILTDFFFFFLNVEEHRYYHFNQFLKKYFNHNKTHQSNESSHRTVTD